MPVTLLYVTAPDRETAEELAATLVAERLVACGNVLGSMTSVYRWEGRVRREEEVALLLKTTAERADAATDRLVELHPYETPCVLSLPVAGGHGAFLGWVAGEVAAGADGSGVPVGRG